MNDVDRNSVLCVCVYAQCPVEVTKKLKSQNTTVQNFSVGFCEIRSRIPRAQF